MTNRGVGEVGIKLLGLWALLSAVSNLPTVVWFAQGQLESGGDGALAIGLGATVQVAIGVSLLAYAKRLAAFLFPADATIPTVTSSTLAVVAFAGIGCYLVVDALPELLRLVLNYRSAGGLDYEYNRELFLRDNAIGISVEVLRLVLGAALFLGAPGLVRIWRRVRSMSEETPDGR